MIFSKHFRVNKDIQKNNIINWGIKPSTAPIPVITPSTIRLLRQAEIPILFNRMPVLILFLNINFSIKSVVYVPITPTEM